MEIVKNQLGEDYNGCGRITVTPVELIELNAKTK